MEESKSVKTETLLSVIEAQRNQAYTELAKYIALEKEQSEIIIELQSKIRKITGSAEQENSRLKEQLARE